MTITGRVRVMIIHYVSFYRSQRKGLQGRI